MIDIIVWAMAGILGVFILFVAGVGIWAVREDRKRKKKVDE